MVFWILQAVKRPADSFVTKEDKEKQEDEEKQHKEWVDFHRMLARVAKEAQLVNWSTRFVIEDRQ